MNTYLLRLIRKRDRKQFHIAAFEKSKYLQIVHVFSSKTPTSKTAPRWGRKCEHANALAPPPPKNTRSRGFYNSVISDPPGINHSLLSKCFKIIEKETSLPSIRYKVGILIPTPGQNDVKIANTSKELFV